MYESRGVHLDVIELRQSKSELWNRWQPKRGPERGKERALANGLSRPRVAKFTSAFNSSQPTDVVRPAARSEREKNDAQHCRNDE